MCIKDSKSAGIAAMAQMLEGLGTSATGPRLLSGVFVWNRCGFFTTARPCFGKPWHPPLAHDGCAS